MGTHTKRSKNILANSDYYMFGLHAVKAVIENPNRKKHALWISQNARAKVFDNHKIPKIPIFNLDKSKAPISDNKVHQGAILKVSPLKQPRDIFEIQNPKQPKLVVILDKVSDPKNVALLLDQASTLIVMQSSIPTTVAQVKMEAWLKQPREPLNK